MLQLQVKHCTPGRLAYPVAFVQISHQLLSTIYQTSPSRKSAVVALSMIRFTALGLQGIGVVTKSEEDITKCLQKCKKKDSLVKLLWPLATLPHRGLVPNSNQGSALAKQPGTFISTFAPPLRKHGRGPKSQVKTAVQRPPRA